MDKPIHKMSKAEYKAYRTSLMGQNKVGLSEIQKSTLSKIESKGNRIIGIMHGTVGWNWRWPDDSTDDLPETLTMESLQCRNLVWQYTRERRTEAQIEAGEVIFSIDVDDYGC